MPLLAVEGPHEKDANGTSYRKHWPIASLACRPSPAGSTVLLNEVVSLQFSVFVLDICHNFLVSTMLILQRLSQDLGRSALVFFCGLTDFASALLLQPFAVFRSAFS